MMSYMYDIYIYYERLMLKEKVLIDCEKGTPKLICPKSVYAKNNLYPNIYIYIYIYIYNIFNDPRLEQLF